MKIGIIGATGKLGGILTTKLNSLGYDVTAIVRNKEKLSTNIDYLERDIYNISSEDIKNFNIIINAFNANSNDPSQFITSTQHLIDILKNGNTRLLFAGGAGILLVDENTMLVDTPDVPEEFKPIAEAEVDAFKLLEKETSFDWTYMAPPAIMEYDAPYKGKHYFSGTRLGVNTDGNSHISYEDYADAFIAQIENPDNHKIIGVYS